MGNCLFFRVENLRGWWLMKLTEKQKRFADFYIEKANATQAYIDAGYKATSRAVAEANARRLLANDSVKNHIKERMAEKDKERIASQDEVLQFLTAVMRNEITEETPMLSGNGFQGMVDKGMSAKDRIKSAELLGKRYSLFTENHNVDMNAQVVIVKDLEDDDE